MKSTTELINKLSKKRKSEENRYRNMDGVNSHLTDKPKKNTFNKRLTRGTVSSSVSTNVRMGE